MAFFRKSDATMLRTAYELSAGMLSFIVAIALGWWFGRTLDRWLGTGRWMTAVFLAL
jgi:F0F1-type ATP synthase assembly protein I